ncbi:MAG: hypothetical protein EOO20_25265, partial [Chryseobacterium sp.]
TKDFKSYQYYSGPNQVIADGLSSHWNDHEPWYMNSRDRASFKINHRPSCCGGNVNRMLPVFSSAMWMKDKDNGIVAALYSSSVFRTKVEGVKGEVAIREQTNYPFDENINFKISLKQKANLTLSFRIPEWCKGARLSVNGKVLSTSCEAGTFAKIKQEFVDGDIIELLLPMKVREVYQPENGIAYQYGPLVYALPINAKTIVKSSKVENGVTFNSTLKTPGQSWNFAPIENAEVNVVKTADFSDPWNPEKSPIRLSLNAVEINNWKLYRETYTPQLPSILEMGHKKQITLVPLGSTELRLSIFPDILKRYTDGVKK